MCSVRRHPTAQQRPSFRIINSKCCLLRLCRFISADNAIIRHKMLLDTCHLFAIAHHVFYRCVNDGPMHHANFSMLTSASLTSNCLSRRHLSPPYITSCMLLSNMNADGCTPNEFKCRFIIFTSLICKEHLRFNQTIQVFKSTLRLKEVYRIPWSVPRHSRSQESVSL